MNQFENDVKDFCEIGGKIFLTKGNVVGDDETFYRHCIRFYFPANAKGIFESYSFGLGIFKIQGY